MTEGEKEIAKYFGPTVVIRDFNRLNSGPDDTAVRYEHECRRQRPRSSGLLMAFCSWHRQGLRF
jgi:hypothetical protein